MKVIPLKFGAMFKQAFSQPEVFNHFVQDVLDISFHAETIHTEYEYPEPIGFVRSSYDLFAKDEDKRIIVEIQHIKEDDFFDRFLYYHLISLVEQAGGYDEYRFNQTVYTIVVLTSTPRDGSVNFSCAISDMNPIDEYGKEEGKIELAKNLLDVLEIETIALKSGLTLEKVKELKDKQ
jgi:hypothetical protein